MAGGLPRPKEKTISDREGEMARRAVLSDLHREVQAAKRGRRLASIKKELNLGAKT